MSARNLPPRTTSPDMFTSTDEEAIFVAALDCADQQAQAAYLEQACGGDAALRERISLLLSAYGEGDFLEVSPSALATAVYPAVTEKPGAVIGPYKLLEQIGEGGMGLVFMAEQSQPLRRRVALKIVKPGLDTRAVIARFEAERQALALMDHPNIARVYDAGATESGRPYFVMELVRGIPITDYCRHHQLDLQTRLALFIEVCQAVQHAHQKGIIHRDLKPSNILVAHDDTTPIPKVIDFGVAKATTSQALTEKTLFTAFTQIIGTPLYMSPEQAEFNCQDVDTRSDVYSLGVVLYELLTGTTPFGADRLRSAGPDEMRRIIREEDPPKPSTRATTLAAAASPATTVAASKSSRRPKPLATSLKGDLDWIVMKCLEKDRRRRYESPSALSADVRRHLDREPIVARPATMTTRLVKWSRRHRTATLATAVVAVMLLMFSSAFAADRWRQIREGSAYVREAIAAACSAFAAGDISQASLRLAEADTRIEANNLTSEELKARVAELTREAERYNKFARLLEQARRHRNGTAVDMAPAEEAIELYGVMTSADWIADLNAIDAPDAHVERVRRGVYELLLLKADHLTRYDSVRSAENTQLATKCLEKAGCIQPPSRGYYWLLANCAHFSDDKEKAAQLREIALETAPHHAAELFFVNRDRSGGTASANTPYSFEDCYRDHREMLRFDPSYYNGLFFMALRLSEEQRHEEALVAWCACVSLRPEDWTAYSNRAFTHLMLGNVRECLADLEKAIPKLLERNDGAAVLNNAAWVLATHPDDAVRNGLRAVELAERACKLTGYKEHDSINTLAAAYAEAGDFATAARWATKALALAESETVRAEDQAFLATIQNKQPWRETPKSGVGAGTRLLAAEHLQKVGKFDAAATLFSDAWDSFPVRYWDGGRGLRGSVDRLAVSSDEVFERLIKIRPEDLSLYMFRADYLASYGRWDQLPNLLERHRMLDPDDYHAWMESSTVSLYLGDMETHKKVCREQLERLKDTTDQPTADRLAKICALTPDPENLDLVVRLAERTMERQAPKAHQAWFHFSKGLAYYRAGRFEEALENAKSSADKSERRFCKPIALVLKAMAEHQLGLPGAATSLQGADEAIRRFDLQFNGQVDHSWGDWLRYQILKREAVQLLGGEPSPS